MYRFFVEKEMIGEIYVTITGEDVNHIKNVLRMKIGEEILISDKNDREYICEISELNQDSVLAKIVDINGTTRELPIKVYLYQGLAKGDKMENIIQKNVELGVYKVIPVAMKRSIMKIDKKKEKNKIDRWNAIANSAAKQSKRGIIPEVSNVLSFREAVDEAKNMDLLLMPYENAEGMRYTKELIENITVGQNVAIFIGPEGGFAPEEVEYAKENGAKEITLGKRILRTETAGMMLMSVLMYTMEE